MRKNLGIWAAAVATVLSLQQLAPAQSKLGARYQNRTRTNQKITLLQALELDDEGSEPSLRLDNQVDDENVDRIVMAEGDGPGKLAPEPEGTVPAPGAACEPVCCVECPEFWEHRDAIWAEFLYLHPRGSDVTYATAVNGTITTSVPIANKSVAAFNYDTGFKVGASWALDPCSSFTGNYTWFRGAITDELQQPGGGAFIRSETTHPSTINVAADSLSALANYDIDFETADFNYKSIVWGGSDYAFNYLVGIKYAALGQQFQGRYSILGTTTVSTNVDFFGVGPRVGFEGERAVGDCGLMLYTKGAVNFLAGNVTADYLQQNIFAGTQARTGLRDARIVTMPELEIGAGWQSCGGCVRLTVGYYLAAWQNMMTTSEYLSIVRVNQNTYDRPQQTLTFDGLTARAEIRF